MQAIMNDADTIGWNGSTYRVGDDKLRENQIKAKDEADAETDFCLNDRPDWPVASAPYAARNDDERTSAPLLRLSRDLFTTRSVPISTPLCACAAGRQSGSKASK